MRLLESCGKAMLMAGAHLGGKCCCFVHKNIVKESGNFEAALTLKDEWYVVL